MQDSRKKERVFYLVTILLFCCSPAALAGSFTDNGNGSVTDNTTALIWQQQDDNIGRSWEEAISYCEGLSLAGVNDWRLPNVKELQTIIDESTYNPAINSNYFPGTNSFEYWSSTADSPNNSSRAWLVYFNDGYVGTYYKSHYGYVRCVRGGQ